ncbi:MAG: permease prefix domain 1-containing protein [Pseudolysinimonas sp.]|uniref:permease prefix domain 1-containing protein n=1 Tax=Pseudolysinimonas sp. TaxID=2680009 RepID=UPI003C736467
MDARETWIAEWRAALERGGAVDAPDADELEGHLRDQIAELETAGLTGEEAFQIAVGRLGKVDQLTAEYAREHGDRMWKQLITPVTVERGRHSILTMLGFAALAAAIMLAARLGAGTSDSEVFLFNEPISSWFVRDLGLFVLPVLAAYFAMLRRVPWRRVLVLAGVVAVLALAANLFPFEPGSASDQLIWIHLPVALWFVVGIAYAGRETLSSSRRMDVIRFSGEWAIYYALIALGGFVLLILTVLVLAPISSELIDELVIWALPAGAAGAVVVAAWLVEAKKSIVENLAPVLTAIFTPLFAAMLIIATVAYSTTSLVSNFDRDLLAVFDILLLVVLGLVVYGISARPATSGAGVMDVIRLVAVVAAIALDILVLIAMFGRVGDLGFTVNRAAALGLNLVLLVNLVGTAWFTGRLLAGRDRPVHLERWQTGYLPVFLAWVLVVILVLPPVFGFA